MRLPNQKISNLNASQMTMRGKSEVRVCERVKNRIEGNQREESQGGRGGQLELNQCVCPLCLINCLSGHHCKSY